MSELKTLPNDADPKAFIATLDSEAKRQDSLELLEMFTRLTGEEPKMWGGSIIGFGQYHYKSERSAQEGDWPLVGFSPRKQNLTLYVLPGVGSYADTLQGLGKYKASVSCVYINKLADVDRKVLEQIIKQSYADMKKQHPAV